MGPTRGLRPPSPRRYRLERSASLTGTFFREAAWPRRSATSPAGTVRLTGSLRPPWGGIKSFIGGSPKSGPLDAVNSREGSIYQSRGPLPAGKGNRWPRAAGSNLVRQGVGLVGPAHEVGEGTVLEHPMLLGL